MNADENASHAAAAVEWVKSTIPDEILVTLTIKGARASDLAQVDMNYEGPGPFAELPDCGAKYYANAVLTLLRQMQAAQAPAKP